MQYMCNGTSRTTHQFNMECKFTSLILVEYGVRYIVGNLNFGCTGGKLMIYCLVTKFGAYRALLSTSRDHTSMTSAVSWVPKKADEVREVACIL